MQNSKCRMRQSNPREDAGSARQLLYNVVKQRYCQAERRPRSERPPSGRRFIVNYGCQCIYCDFSRKNSRPAVAGTFTEIWPALVTADGATGDHELASERFVLS